MAYESTVLAALADPTRAQVFEQLAERPKSVAEIARAVPVSRPAVSQHLRVLLDARLVSFEKSGTRHVYRLDLQGLAWTRDWLNGFWTSALEHFKTQIENPKRHPHDHRRSSRSQIHRCRFRSPPGL